MSWLLNVYWFSLGIGGIYLLVAGALGALGGHGGGHGAGHDLGGGHDAGLDAGGHDGPAMLPSADLDSGSLDGGGLDAAGHAASQDFAHGPIIADHAPDSGFSTTDLSPFNLLNLMCLLACFGGTGLALIASRVPTLLTFPLALASGLLLTGAFHWLVANVLMKFQALAVPSQTDMLGLDAEVITPLEGSGYGEIAYILDGQRFTAPAKLASGEHAGRQDSVTIVRVEGNTAYVEARRRILE